MHVNNVNLFGRRHGFEMQVLDVEGGNENHLQRLGQSRGKGRRRNKTAQEGVATAHGKKNETSVSAVLLASRVQG